MHLEKAHTANLPNFTTVLQIIEDLVPCFELNGEFADKDIPHDHRSAMLFAISAEV